MHASDETQHSSPLRQKFDNGPAYIRKAGPDRAPHSYKAIPEGRGGAALLPISAGANASHVRSPLRDEVRIQEDLSTSISGNR